MYLQTFNNSFMKRVFISDFRMTLRDSIKRLQDRIHKRPQQDDFLDVESRLSLPVV